MGFGSTELIVLRATTTVLPQFLYRTTTLSEFRSIGADAMTGAAGQQRVPPTFVGNFQAALPPLPEQSAIVRFLDYFDHRINRLIRAKRRLIELLNEQKQAIIHRAVTRGLDPNVRLKPSGIDWLGEVPEHWEIKKLKYMVRFYGGGTPSKAVAEYWNGDIPWVSPKDMKTELVEDAQDHITEEAVIQSSTKLVDPGAVLLVVRSGILRRTIPVAMNRRTVALNQDMKALVTKPALTAGYLAALVRGNQQVLLAE